MSTRGGDHHPRIVGSSPATERLRRLVRRVADTDATVLITGESGSGKELVARHLHSGSQRSRGPFVAINCAALNPGVLESELFGHGKGSFTGAVQAHVGLFEQANGGTLFLDEIGEIAGFVQAKLLRVLQERSIRRMGSVTERDVNVRIVAATNANLEALVQEGRFRADLYYRLNVIELAVSPLRDRHEDLFELIDAFFTSRDAPVPGIPPETRRVLCGYPWPGNVRELHNELERLLAFHPHARVILPTMLSDRIRQRRTSGEVDVKQLYDAPLPKALGYLEESLLRKTLTKHGWNKSRSARELGLSRHGLLKKIKRYGITESDDAVDS